MAPPILQRVSKSNVEIDLRSPACQLPQGRRIGDNFHRLARTKKLRIDFTLPARWTNRLKPLQNLAATPACPAAKIEHRATPRSMRARFTCQQAVGSHNVPDVRVIAT